MLRTTRRRASAAAGRSTAASGSSPAPRARPSRSAWRIAPTSGRDDVPGRRRQPRLADRARRSTPSTAASPAATPRSSSRTAASRDDAVLGEVGEGFRYAQVRLAPGAPDPLHALARRRAARPRLRARPRGDARGVRPARSASSAWCRRSIADSVIDIETSRLLIWRCAWALDQRRSRPRTSPRSPRPTSPRRSDRVVDRAVQICGALGVSGDAPLARLTERGAAVPDLRRADRDAPLGDRPARRVRARDRRPMPEPIVRDAARGGGGSSAAPLIVLEPLREFLDAAGLGAGAIEAERDRRRPLEPDLPAARAARRGSSCAGRRAAPLAALGPRRPARSAGAGALATSRRSACPRCSADCEDPSVIGAPFYVMAYVDGEVDRPTTLPAGARPPRGAARGSPSELVDALVELHAVDLEARGLAELGRPDGYLERQLRRFGGLLEQQRDAAAAGARARSPSGSPPTCPAQPPRDLRPRRLPPRQRDVRARRPARRRGPRLGDGDGRRPARRPRLPDRDVGGAGRRRQPDVRPLRGDPPPRLPRPRRSSPARYAEATGRRSTPSAGTRCWRSGRRRSSSRAATAATSPAPPPTPISRASAFPSSHAQRSS